MTIRARVGKVPVHVRRDIPGFVGNRLQHALRREAISLVEHGVCDAEAVDTVIKQSFGLRLQLVAAGTLGANSGHGFGHWDADRVQATQQWLFTHLAETVGRTATERA